MNQYGTKKDREQSFIQKLAITKPTFTYISGYKDAKSNVLVKCNKCGYEMYRGVDRLTRKNKNIICRNCEKLKMQKENNKKKLIAQQKKRVQEIKLERQKEINQINKYLISNTISIKHCAVCKKEYIEKTKSNYCAKCRRKIHHHHSSKSLVKLFKRDKGVCYICGGLCNWNDKIEDKNTIIVGKTYPSIDHVVPLVEGGTDDWNNLKLAHFECNRVKGGVS